MSNKECDIVQDLLPFIMTKPAVRQAAALLKSIWQVVVTARRYIMNYRKTTLMKCLQRNQKEYLKDMQKKERNANIQGRSCDCRNTSTANCHYIYSTACNWYGFRRIFGCYCFYDACCNLR